jgi:hypothetical protein
MMNIYEESTLGGWVRACVRACVRPLGQGESGSFKLGDLYPGYFPHKYSSYLN